MREKKKELKHILVEDSIRKELKIRAVRNDTTIGEIVKYLLNKDKENEEISE